MSRLPAGAFRRYDETPDEEFYKTPRLVTHIDDRAIAAVAQLYRELPGGRRDPGPHEQLGQPPTCRQRCATSGSQAWG